MSRLKYLDRVLEAFNNQSCKSDKLVVIHDGQEDDFEFVRERVMNVNCREIVCVPSTTYRPAPTIPERRTNIVNVHKQFQSLVEDADWVFSIEDDGVIPSFALENLLHVSVVFSNPGLVSGVELGRHGTPYVGAWTVDDITNPTYIESLPQRQGLQQVDATGLYCAVIRGDLYRQHQFTARNGLGPDVNLGLYSRQQGYKNYVDWRVGVTHLAYLSGEEVEIKATDPAIIAKMRHLSDFIWERVY